MIITPAKLLKAGCALTLIVWIGIPVIIIVVSLLIGLFK